MNLCSKECKLWRNLPSKFPLKVNKFCICSLSDSNAQNIINQALYLGNPSVFNTTRDDCKWKYGNERDVCPDPDINVILYTGTTDGKNRGKLSVSFWPCAARLKSASRTWNTCYQFAYVKYRNYYLTLVKTGTLRWTRRHWSHVASSNVKIVTNYDSTHVLQCRQQQWDKSYIMQSLCNLETVSLDIEGISCCCTSENLCFLIDRSWTKNMVITFWRCDFNEKLWNFKLKNLKILIRIKSLQVDSTDSQWLHMSALNSSKENIILVHGYAGGDDILPMVVLRDAYMDQGNYNVFVVDWSSLSTTPC